MANREERFRTFFERYARVSFGPNPEQLADCYDTSFLVAGPNGGATFGNDASFHAWLRTIHALNAERGMTALTPGSIRETPVGGGYTLVAVEWATTFRLTGDVPIRFTISYLLRQHQDDLKIAAYISHEDEAEVMRAHGLL